MVGGEEGSVVIATERRGVRDTLGTYAELVRVPNLFTAPPDVILGAALVAAAGAGGNVASTEIVGLAIASMFLYAGGTTLNDAFDAPKDRLERPERPIPSGRVSRRTAFALGTSLLVFGIVVAFVATGVSGGLVAGLLAAAIVTYDGWTKGSAAGFLTMGATRGLNVVLGTTAGAVSLLSLPASALLVSLVVAAYIAAVTGMAAGETVGENRGAVGLAIGAVLGSVLAVGGFHVVTGSGALEAATALAFAVAFLWWVGRPLRAAVSDPTPATVGPAVGACVLGLVLLNAAFAAASGVLWALAAGVFLVPARGLSQVFDVT
ncbi:4-hydroxybenzoate polyprenyltransferase [Natronorubrum sediminis]|uniref:4-hydroxybenzoate polyprenyltransferase n=1 Tax=Natronorubrum sediminis TaxID=640943 RepID=A0A1H6G1E3_9EURY|nr:UbiA family prenyltransferase [Natronorubrum sediminis]SEH16879.1 4-hydroxybenzoate polyprenyltransferase [Natronorubrum sediminis]